MRKLTSRPLIQYDSFGGQNPECTLSRELGKDTKDSTF